MISDIDRKVKLEKLFDNKKTRSSNSWRVKAAPANVAGKIFRAEKLKITRKNEPTPSLESAFRAKGGTFLLTCVQISQNHYFVQFRSAGSQGRGVKTAQKLDF